MRFFKQEDNTSCQYVALQTALSFYNIFPTKKELRKALPKHSFGNLITELGIYVESIGIKTVLVSSFAKVRPTNRLFWNSLEEYKKVGVYEDREVSEEDITNYPVIGNVDRYKLIKEIHVQGPHYVVLNKLNNIFLYDGKSNELEITCDFEKVLLASKNINRYHDDGMWLLFR